MKRIDLSAILFLPLSILLSCSTDLGSYNGDNMIRFVDNVDDVYTFAYYSNEKRADTLKIKLMTIGEVTNHPRTVHYEQVKKKWKYK